MAKKPLHNKFLDPYGHKGKGGVWSAELGHCACPTCVIERQAKGEVGMPVERSQALVERKSRWLCVCARGNCRSVHLAAIIKEELNRDAIAYGIELETPETLEILGNWADVIALCDADLDPLVPPSWRSKLVLFDVGPDRFFGGWHPELIQLFRQHLYDLKSRSTQPPG